MSASHNRKRILTAAIAIALVLLVGGPITAWSLGAVGQLNSSQLAAQASGPDVSKLTGENWMSAIPDDRYLYEINIPGTHDSSMKNSMARKWYMHMSAFYVYAETQHLYLNEQLDAGVRLFDLRFTDGQYLPDDIKPGDSDDKAYNCHGDPTAAVDCLFLARDKNKVQYNSRSTLELMCKFLKEHPSETLIVSMDYESGSNAESTMKRLRKCVDSFAAQKNPQTNKSYIYTQGDNKIITTMPMLKDVRGQIVILSGRTDLLGYGMQVSLGNTNSTTTIAGTPFAYENHYEVRIHEKRNILKVFFNGGSYDEVTSAKNILDLPKNLNTRVEHGNYVYTTSNRPPIINFWNCSPGEVAEQVNPILYRRSNAIFKTVGRYYGWVCSDYVKEDDIKTLWKTNFPDDLEYVTYTLKYGSLHVPDRSFSVMKGSTITLPTVKECYDLDLDSDRGLKGWLVNGSKTLKPGDTLVVNDTTTIEVQWGMTWDDLQDLIHEHSRRNDASPIRLNADVTSGNASAPLKIPSGSNITIDLNGYNLKRSVYGKGEVFSLSSGAHLTIAGKGRVTGGSASKSNHGVIGIYSGSSLTLKDEVEIRDNRALLGGAVGVYAGGTLNVQDSVKIQNNWNDKQSCPGDVYLAQGSVIKITGKLSDSARIGVVSDTTPIEGYPVPVSQFLPEKGSTSNFFSCNERYQIASYSGEAHLFDSLTATFDTLGGTSVDKQYVKTNDKVSKPADPQRDHSIFKGWYTSADGGEEFDFDKPIRSSLTLYARWEPGAQIINFYSEGGTDVPSQTVSYGSLATKPVDPTREGYTFTGWKYIVTGPVARGLHVYNFDQPVTHDWNLTAFWEPITCTVTFEGRGGSETESQTVGYGKQATMPDNPTREGYAFTNWTLEDGTAFDFGRALREDVTLYANWLPTQRTVTFDSEGGSSVSAQRVTYDTPVAAPRAPYRAGYEFVDWREEMVPQVPYDFSLNVTSDLNLHATWRPISYTVSFDARGGSEVAPQIVEYGQKVTKPAEDPTREGYAFTGWVYLPDQDPYIKRSPKPYSFDSLVTGNMTLFASWAPNSCTVSFDSRGGSEVEAQTVVYGATAAQPAAPSKEGFFFAGWFADEACTITYGFDAPVCESMTLYAGWNEDPVDSAKLVIVFDSAGGTPVDHQVLEVGQTVVEPPSPTRYGYEFGGWFVDGDSSQPYDFGTRLAGDLLLKAQWTPIICTVSFDAMGGSGAPEPQRVPFATLASAPSDPTREGYDFAGWYAEDPDAMSDEDAARYRNDPGLSRDYWITDDNHLRYYFDFEYTLIRGDQTLYARWTPQTHAVTFDARGGSDVEVQGGIAHGTAAPEPADPTREHYSFNGWFTDAECNNPYDFDLPLSADLTLYAGWVPQVYEVLFVPGNDGECQVRNVAFGSAATKPDDPKRQGYHFDGWFVDGDTDKPYDFSAAVQESLVIMGRWTPESYTVTFDVDDGTPEPAMQQVSAGNLVEQPSDPTKSRQQFMGWYAIVADNLSDEDIDAIAGDTVAYDQMWIDGRTLLAPYDFMQPVDGPLNLRARWQADAHTVTFDVSSWIGTSMRHARVPTTSRSPYRATLRSMPDGGTRPIPSPSFAMVALISSNRPYPTASRPSCQESRQCKDMSLFGGTKTKTTQ